MIENHLAGTDPVVGLSNRIKTVPAIYCEFVGQPLLTGKPARYSTLEDNWEKHINALTSNNWYSANVNNYAAGGWSSRVSNEDAKPWLSVHMGRAYVVKMVIFMGQLDCCKGYIGAATARVGYRADGENQPICAHYESTFAHNSINFMPCLTLIKGTFVTIHFHKIRHPGMRVPKIGAFGFTA